MSQAASLCLTDSGGRGCLGEGRLGLSGEVWEFRFLPSFPSFPRENWGCAKGAEKASCGETVVQKGVLESPFLLFPLKVFRCFQGKPYWGREETDSPKTPFWTTVSPHDAFSAPLARSEKSQFNKCLGNAWKSQTSVFQTSAAF